jgi:hypothetical protein
MNRKMFWGVIVAVCLTTTYSCSRNQDNKRGLINSVDSAVSTDSLRIIMTSDRFQVLDVYGGSYANNTKVGLYEFNSNGNQLWSIKKVGKDYIIRSYFSKKVLAINMEDSLLVQQEYNGSDNQHWLLFGEIDSILIKNKALGKCLTYAKDIVLDNCTKKTTQYWIIQSSKKLQGEMDSCDCNENFNFIKNRIETSYSGFQDKVNPSTKAEYERVRMQSEKAAKESSGSAVSCFEIIHNYLSFFHDGHIHFNLIGNQRNNSYPRFLFYKLEKNTNAGWFDLKNVNDSTLLLSLPNFKQEYKSLVDGLINRNESKLLKTPYLIIDIRGNGGGTDVSFYGILPFLYTNPFELYGNDILASIETIKTFEKFEQRNASEKKLSQDAEQFRTQLDKMREHQGEFVLRTKDHEVKFDKILKNPRKIAILINQNCASSAEEFLLYARESKKVKLLGQPTAGTLDYSNVVSVPCPSLFFKFGYATTRSHRLPRFSVDRDKIQPNIYLADNTDWIAEALKQFKQ